MILVPFYENLHGDRLAKNVKSLSVQIIPRSTAKKARLTKVAKLARGHWLWAMPIDSSDFKTFKEK